MDNRVIISLIDLGLESFWKEPTTAKIEGNFGRELVAKSYLKEKGLTSEDIETNIDKIKFKLASLEDKDKNVQQPMPPPGSVDGKSTSDFSYQVRSQRSSPSWCGEPWLIGDMYLTMIVGTKWEFPPSIDMDRKLAWAHRRRL